MSGTDAVRFLLAQGGILLLDNSGASSQKTPERLPRHCLQCPGPVLPGACTLRAPDMRGSCALGHPVYQMTGTHMHKPFVYSACVCATPDCLLRCVHADRSYYEEAFDVIPKHWLRFDDIMVSNGGLRFLFFSFSHSRRLASSSLCCLPARVFSDACGIAVQENSLRRSPICIKVLVATLSPSLPRCRIAGAVGAPVCCMPPLIRGLDSECFEHSFSQNERPSGSPAARVPVASECLWLSVVKG